MKKQYIKPRSTIVAAEFEQTILAGSRPPISSDTGNGDGDSDEKVEGPIPGDDDEIPPTEAKHFTFDIWTDEY